MLDAQQDALFLDFRSDSDLFLIKFFEALVSSSGSLRHTKNRI